MRSATPIRPPGAAIAGYVNYAFNDQWRVSTRIEYFDDKDGFNTGVEQHLWEGTVTFGYSPAKSFELRGEFRYDSSQDAGFLRGIEPRRPASEATSRRSRSKASTSSAAP